MNLHAFMHGRHTMTCMQSWEKLHTYLKGIIGMGMGINCMYKIKVIKRMLVSIITADTGLDVR